MLTKYQKNELAQAVGQEWFHGDLLLYEAIDKVVETVDEKDQQEARNHLASTYARFFDAKYD